MSPLSDEDIGRRVARAEFVTRAWLVTAGVVLTLLLVITSVGTTLIYYRGRDSHATLRAIESCTTPGEKCFVESQKRTGDAVASINKVVILAAACASQRPGQSIAAIQACVINRLSAARHKGH